jgi:hypothetical protein
MFTKIDDILYPNRVEVYDFRSVNKFVYPIFKCGKTTLEAIANDKGFKKVINEQIKNISEIDVFIRNPRERYLSGVRSYFHWLKKDNPDIDLKTVIFYLKQGVIFDRHFLPQISWIINLGRYMSPEAKINVHSMGMLNEYCQGINVVPEKNSDIDLSELSSIPALELHHRLDQLMLDELVGDSWTVNQIMTHLMTRDPTAYFSIIGRVQHIAGVAHVLPKV